MDSTPTPAPSRFRWSRGKQIAVAILAAVGVGAIVTASAASLGPLSPQGIGTSASEAAACTSSGLGWDWPAGGISFDPNAGNGNYVYNQVRVTGIPASCAGATGSVTVADSDTNTELATKAISVPGDCSNCSVTVTLDSAVRVSPTNRVAIVLVGGA